MDHIECDFSHNIWYELFPDKRSISKHVFDITLNTIYKQQSIAPYSLDQPKFSYFAYFSPRFNIQSTNDLLKISKLQAETNKEQIPNCIVESQALSLAIPKNILKEQQQQKTPEALSLAIPKQILQRPQQQELLTKISYSKAANSIVKDIYCPPPIKDQDPKHLFSRASAQSNYKPLVQNNHVPIINDSWSFLSSHEQSNEFTSNDKYVQLHHQSKNTMNNLTSNLKP